MYCVKTVFNLFGLCSLSTSFFPPADSIQPNIIVRLFISIMIISSIPFDYNLFRSRLKMVEDLTKNLVKVPKSIAISFEEMPYFVRGDHPLDSE